MNKKRNVAVLLVITFIISLFPSYAMASEKAEKVVYDQNGVTITYIINSQWETGFEGRFVIKNNSSTEIENWRYQFKFQHEITSVWDAEIESHNGDQYVIKYPSWNQNIRVGGQATFGFNGKKQGDLHYPEQFKQIGDKGEINKEEYSITYRTTSDWKDGFNGEISIKNNSTKAIEGWTLEFDFDKEIRQFWTATLLSHEGTHYKIKNQEWNSIIKPGHFVNLGFEGYSGDVKNEPMNFKLTALTSDNAGNEEEEEDKLPDFDSIKDTDGDGMYDFVEESYGW